MKLDVTETAIVAQRFEARAGEKPEDQGYFAFLDRLNAVLSYKRITAGVRLDGSFYALRPEDRSYPDAQTERNILIDASTRYRNAVYPAKLYVRYKDDTLEATAGDSYVQFGRGLVLSLRKVDELGIDTTLFGGKVVFQKDIFGATLLAGIANPARVDEPTGRALFVSQEVEGTRATGANPAQSAIPAQPLFGSDRMVGAQIQAGRGLPVVSSTHGVILTRCAPFSYNADGTINQAPLDAPFGTCNDADSAIWLQSLPAVSPVVRSRQTINAGQSIEAPNLWGHGSLYVEAAVQKRDGEHDTDANTEGNAIYGSFAASGGPVNNTIEVKSYRNFYPLAASVNISKASAFSNIAYSAPPTAEPILADQMFGFYNACVTGARDRLDYRFTPSFLGYVAGGHYVTRSEEPGGMCDRLGRSTARQPDDTTNHVTDGEVGMQTNFDGNRSIALANLYGRHDIRETGTAYYRELAAQYSVTKHIVGPYSIELAGRHRYRVQNGENIRVGSSYVGDPWWQGEHYSALKISPKWIITQGIEYTTLVGLPTYYLNGEVLYRFTPQSNLRVKVGQNRGGLRCVSGICRNFPAFSGARAELTVRF